MKFSGIGIIGGVGPEAGLVLERHVLEETRTQKKVQGDQDHLPVWHVNDPTKIPDRTKFLLGEIEENPAEGAFDVLKVLNGVAAAVGKLIVGVPCNTFHAEKIWGEFVDLIEKGKLENVEVINMVATTIQFLKNELNPGSTIGLMSTTGTRRAEIYKNALEEAKFKVVETDDQERLHDAIYNSEFGIKAVSPVSAEAKNAFEGFARELKGKGADLIIEGCTEIPIAFDGATNFEGISLIDPMRVLAKIMVEKVVR